MSITMSITAQRYPQYQDLVDAAIAALDASHPNQPANLRFGAAVRTRAGNVYAGTVFWSATSTLLLHAEHVALAIAAAHGEREVSTIAMVSTEDPARKAYCHPCGLCKQLIHENAQQSGVDVTVVMANLDGEAIVGPISELTPFPWPT